MANSLTPTKWTIKMAQVKTPEELKALMMLLVSSEELKKHFCTSNTSDLEELVELAFNNVFSASKPKDIVVEAPSPRKSEAPQQVKQKPRNFRVCRYARCVDRHDILFDMISWYGTPEFYKERHELKEDAISHKEEGSLNPGSRCGDQCHQELGMIQTVINLCEKPGLISPEDFVQECKKFIGEKGVKNALSERGPLPEEQAKKSQAPQKKRPNNGKTKSKLMIEKIRSSSDTHKGRFELMEQLVESGELSYMIISGIEERLIGQNLLPEDTDFSSIKERAKDIQRKRDRAKNPKRTRQEESKAKTEPTEKPAQVAKEQPALPAPKRESVSSRQCTKKKPPSLTQKIEAGGDTFEERLKTLNELIESGEATSNAIRRSKGTWVRNGILGKSTNFIELMARAEEIEKPTQVLKIEKAIEEAVTNPL